MSSPSWATIFNSTPSCSLVTSLVSLSVVISRITSPVFTSSPSCLIHWETVPSSMVRPSWGISTSKAMINPPHLFSTRLTALTMVSGWGKFSSSRVGLKGGTMFSPQTRSTGASSSSNSSSAIWAEISPA